MVPAAVAPPGGIAPGLAALAAAVGGGIGGPPIGGAIAPKAGGIGGVAPIDARVLPVEYDATGNRFRSFREAVTGLTDTQWPDWPNAGPQTAVWVVRFMLEKAGSPTAWHAQWKANGRLDENEAWVSVHGSLCKTVEVMVCYDQLDVGALGGVELIVRHIQTIESV